MRELVLAAHRAAAAAAEDDKLAQLERLGKLRDSGVLDAAEFEREKARILEQAPAGAG